jgi:hypothetical protein
LTSSLWHLSSLDAPTVAVVWSLAFARAASVRLPLWVPVLLACGTWAVYIADRLLDARSALATGNTRGLRPRHFFHWRHRRVFVPMAVAAATVAAAIIFTLMPAGIRERNSVLAAAALVYFSGVHLPRRPRWLLPILSKELLVGILFAAGCALPTLTRLHLETAPRFAFFAAVAFFAAIAWLNCHAIDRWESACSAGPAASLLAVAGLLLAFVCIPLNLRCSALFAAGSASALLLAILNRRRNHLAPLTLRATADLVLLTPLVLFFK